jgi:hypothetical protein
LSTAAAVVMRQWHVTDGKIIAFFTFHDFLSVKNMIRAKKIKIFGAKPILLLNSIFDESKNCVFMGQK